MVQGPIFQGIAKQASAISRPVARRNWAVGLLWPFQQVAGFLGSPGDITAQPCDSLTAEQWKEHNN